MTSVKFESKAKEYRKIREWDYKEGDVFVNPGKNMLVLMHGHSQITCITLDHNNAVCAVLHGIVADLHDPYRPIDCQLVLTEKA